MLCLVVHNVWCEASLLLSFAAPLRGMEGPPCFTAILLTGTAIVNGGGNWLAVFRNAAIVHFDRQCIHHRLLLLAGARHPFVRAPAGFYNKRVVGFSECVYCARAGGCMLRTCATHSDVAVACGERLPWPLESDYLITACAGSAARCKPCAS